KANGMVGTVNGLAHMATSVFSGLAIGFLGMGGTIVVSIVLTAAALLHLATIRIDEPHVERSERSRMDVRGTWRTIRAVPGLWALILFAAFNNLVMGVFMALTDPYGLTLFSVETWGIVLGVVGIGFIAGGACVARFGLGRSPLRTLLLVNMLLAVVGVATAIRGVAAVAGARDVRIHVPHPGRRGRRADDSAARGAVRAAGAGVRAGAKCGKRGRTGVVVRDRTACPAGHHPVHGHRRRPHHVRLAARRRPGPRDRAGVRGGKPDHAGHRAGGVLQRRVPQAEPGVRRN